jgi:uncharacterized membrane protein
MMRLFQTAERHEESGKKEAENCLTQCFVPLAPCPTNGEMVIWLNDSKSR